MRFVVFKGAQGFGDRLQCLLQAIRYARASQRYLVLDWRDTDWSHDPGLSTEVFFSLEQVKTFGLKEFLAYYQAYQPSLKVVPNSWKHCMASESYLDWIYKPMFWLGSENEWIDLIATYQRRDYDAEVVVYSGVGKRSFTYSDAQCIRLSTWVQAGIEADFQRHGLELGGYDVVHLRGGSKAWQGGHVPLKDLRERIDARWPSQQSYLHELYAQYQQADEGPAAEKLILLSDHDDLAQAWRRQFGVGETLTTHNQAFAESGTHKMTAAELHALRPGLTKAELNRELLRDFVVMLHARRVISDGVSLFSDMAKKCAASGVRLMNLPKGAAA